jgi:hypothetical protein
VNQTPDSAIHWPVSLSVSVIFLVSCVPTHSNVCPVLESVSKRVIVPPTSIVCVVHVFQRPALVTVIASNLYPPQSARMVFVLRQIAGMRPVVVRV